MHVINLQRLVVLLASLQVLGPLTMWFRSELIRSCTWKILSLNNFIRPRFIIVFKIDLHRLSTYQVLRKKRLLQVKNILPDTFMWSLPEDIYRKRVLPVDQCQINFTETYLTEKRAWHIVESSIYITISQWKLVAVPLKNTWNVENAHKKIMPSSTSSSGSYHSSSDIKWPIFVESSKMFGWA
jgi:hypothetical protein